MELRYCDKCGAVVNCEEGSDEAKRPGAFHCPRCEGAASTSTTPASEASESTPEATSALSFLDDPGPDSSQRAASSAESLEGLADMTVKKEHIPQEVVPPDKTALIEGFDVLANEAPVTRPATENAPEPEREPTRREGSPMKKQGLDLFSSQTIVAKKQKHFGHRPEPDPSVTLQLSMEGLDKSDPSKGGSAYPAKTAKRIQFSCIYCKTKLMVRRVEKMSKMVCPRCGEKMYISPSGQISEKRLDNSSSIVARRSGSGTLVPNLARKDPKDPSSRVVRRSASGSASTRVGSAQLRSPGSAYVADPAHSQEADGRSALLNQVVDEFNQVSGQTAPEEDYRDDQDLSDDGNESFDEDLTGVSRPSPGDTQELTATAALQQNDFEYPDIQRLDESKSQGRTFFRALGFGVLLAAPLFLLGSFITPRDSVLGDPSTMEIVLEKLGKTVSEGLTRLVDKIAEL